MHSLLPIILPISLWAKYFVICAAATSLFLGSRKALYSHDQHKIDAILSRSVSGHGDDKGTLSKLDLLHLYSMTQREPFIWGIL